MTDRIRKGKEGERRVIAVLSRLPGGYRQFHNLIVPARGGTTQIDHVVVSDRGVWVIETKLYGGTIWPADAPFWHQTFGPRRFAFDNPQRQNFRHLAALVAALDLPIESFHPLVVFVEGNFGWNPPAGVTVLYGLVRKIQEADRRLLTAADLDRVLKKLCTLRVSGPAESDHLYSLRIRLLWERVLLPRARRNRMSAAAA